ncbi:hypothetical protein [Streptomyces cinerochromogenes]|uniref:hypothetical protein n=1 Tax=Streptomyces cinerochromogenes TaxID=66422 RepID=UPI0019B71337|nr:hypothetical protein [Streptomyces cinerochromogenes]GGS84964.1 hypothetical protein GCM10010206_54570 [Streptomyces cinerochromogenes]
MHGTENRRGRRTTPRGAWGLGALVAAMLLASSFPANAAPAAAPQAQPASAAQATAVREPECIQPGNARLNPRFYWRNVFGARLGEGVIHESSSPNPFGGRIAPGSTFTFRWRPETTRNPVGAQYHIHRVNLASIMAVAQVESVTGPGSLSGTTLSVQETPPHKLGDTAVRFRIRPGTEGRTATLSSADHSLTTRWLFADINNVWENTGSISFTVASRASLGCDSSSILG